MNNSDTSIRALDIGYVFSGLEHLAAIFLLIIIAKVLIDRPGLLTNKLKSIVWILVTLWSVAVVAQYAAGLYNYVHAIRPFYVQARHNTTGL